MFNRKVKKNLKSDIDTACRNMEGPWSPSGADLIKAIMLAGIQLIKLKI